MGFVRRLFDRLRDAEQLEEEIREAENYAIWEERENRNLFFALLRLACYRMDESWDDSKHWFLPMPLLAAVRLWLWRHAFLTLSILNCKKMSPLLQFHVCSTASSVVSTYIC